MKSLTCFPRILLFKGRVDFRKRRRGLAALVQGELGENPFAPTLFLFMNVRRDCIRALYWDKTGFAMWEKELEEAKFAWPKKAERNGSVVLSAQQVGWLLEGIDIWRLRPHAELSYTIAG